MKILKSRIFMFTLGLVVAGGVSVFAYQMNATQVTYEPNDTNWNVKTVKAAIDDLYNSAGNGESGSSVAMRFAFGDPTSSSTTDYKSLDRTMFGGLYAGKKHICIIKNNKLNCFARDNVQSEQDHLREVFSDGSCETKTNKYGNKYFECVGSSFICDIYETGDLWFYETATHKTCETFANTTVSCY